MIVYLTFLGIFSILIWPLSFLVTLIIKLFSVPKMARKMYPGIEINKKKDTDDDESDSDF